MRRIALAAATAVAGLFLAACGSSEPGVAGADPGPSTTAAPIETSAAPTLADHADRVSAALDTLGVPHTEPVRAQAALGASASFTLTINGADAAIHVFPDEQTLATWVEASNALGGVCVTFDDHVAVSLDSDETITQSIELAPRLADALGGTAHNV